MARFHKFTLPSGVEAEVRNFYGEDYDILTNPSYARNGSQFNKLAAAATVRIGNDNNITEEKVTNLLSNDRKALLLETRMHTMRHNPTFKFRYEWPLRNKKKDAQEYEVTFNSESFPMIPYLWVREKMHDEAQQNGQEEASHHPLDFHFPVLYEDYEDMLSEHSTQRTVLDDGREIHWSVMNGRMEKMAREKLRQTRSPNMMITMRGAHQVGEMSAETTADGAGAAVKMPFNPAKEDVYDLEAIRTDIFHTEGEINTFVVIENQKEAGEQQRVDLLTTESFFFPSMVR